MDCNERRQVQKIVRKEMKKRDKLMNVVGKAFLLGAIAVCFALTMIALVYTMMIV